MELGESLEGLTFFATGGEPMTVAKRKIIKRAGAKTTVLYGCEPGTVHVGFGCANPVYIYEMHVNLNTLGVIPNPKPIKLNGQKIQPLLFTTLYPFNCQVSIEYRKRRLYSAGSAGLRVCDAKSRS